MARRRAAALEPLRPVRAPVARHPTGWCSLSLAPSLRLAPDLHRNGGLEPAPSGDHRHLDGSAGSEARALGLGGHSRGHRLQHVWTASRSRRRAEPARGGSLDCTGRDRGGLARSGWHGSIGRRARSVSGREPARGLSAVQRLRVLHVGRAAARAGGGRQEAVARVVEASGRVLDRDRSRRAPRGPSAPCLPRAGRRRHP